MFNSLTTYDADASRAAKFKRFGALINVVQVLPISLDCCQTWWLKCVFRQLIVGIPYAEWSPYYLLPQRSLHDPSSGALVLYQPIVRWNIFRLQPDTPKTLADSREQIHVSDELPRSIKLRRNPNETTQVKKATRLPAKEKSLRDLGINNQKSNTPKVLSLKQIPAISRASHSYLRKGTGARAAKGVENVRTAEKKVIKLMVKGKDKDTKAQEIDTKKSKNKGLKPNGTPTVITTDQAVAGFAARRRRRTAAAK